MMGDPVPDIAVRQLCGKTAQSITIAGATGFSLGRACGRD
jgi:hypothetical protein